MAARRGVRFKAGDIWDAPDDEYRYEVVDGELYMTPAPGWAHQRALGRLYLRIGEWVYRHGLGEAVQAPIGVVLDEETAVQPDLVYVSRERTALVSERGVEGAPDLVVEVLSPSTQARDRGIKMRRYAAGGSLTTGFWIPRLEPWKPIGWASRGTSARASTRRAGRCGRSCSPVWRSPSTIFGRD